MDVAGSEIGQKMRSAIKAKLTECGCYVDDELPDYVMVMVANKRTREQMEDDLQLFLGDNTDVFVNWLHQVLKKLQEVSVPTTKPGDKEKGKDKEKSKDKKSKDKKAAKEKDKKTELKKAKKKEKEKEKKELKKKEKKANKKKKSKHDEIIRPNIPPLLMNIEKESEPSITDVFAGQILKNHGILIETPKEIPKETKPDVKPLNIEKNESVKRPIVPIIDPATIMSEPQPQDNDNDESLQDINKSPEVSVAAPRHEQLKEINEIEAKIQGLKQKLAEQLDSMSDDEDFLNIRTEAEELMNDFAEDVFQEISQQTTDTPPIPPEHSPARSQSPIEIPEPQPKSPIRLPETPKEPEVLPSIELKLPKRPIRERLGIREETKSFSEEREKVKEKREKQKISESPERFTPEREPEFHPPKSAKSRLGDPPEAQRKHSPHRKRSPLRKHSTEEKSEKTEPASKRLTSKVSVLANRRQRGACASVVRVRPRPRVPGQASSLLLRAVADAHKSLLNIPPKKDPESTIKRALVLPMRRAEPQKILIQVTDVADDNDGQDAISLGDPESEDSKMGSDAEHEYVPKSITKKFHNTDYTPSLAAQGRTTTQKDDTLIIEAINIHNPTADKDKNTKFIVTMDGYHPNAFLAKKLQTEGILEEEKTTKSQQTDQNSPKRDDKAENAFPKVKEEKNDSPKVSPETSPQKKRISDTSEESDTQVIIDTVQVPEKILEIQNKIEKRKATSEALEMKVPIKRRKSSPIVFSVGKKEIERTRTDSAKKEIERTRTESVGSDNHVVVTTAPSTHKYDSLPPLSTERKPLWCRSFPQCRYGASCAFQHPRCRFAAACTRRNCVYSHAPPLSPVPALASHVVPSANFKSITASALPTMCKYYPSCSNPACHFLHPKPCRYGIACVNKFECNFYHADVPGKWKYSV